MQIADVYVQFIVAFIEMLSDLESICDGPLRQINIETSSWAIRGRSKASLLYAILRGPESRRLSEERDKQNAVETSFKDGLKKRAATILVVSKKDVPLVFCIHYQKFNALRKRNVYPIPLIDEFINSLREAAVCFMIDAKSGYCQTEIKNGNWDKTNFISNHAFYRFLRLPFELWNASSTFQRKIDITLSTVKWQLAFVDHDDFVTFTRPGEERIDHVKHLLTISAT